MTDDENLKTTLETYHNLGKTYIQNSEGINLPKLPEFIKILPKGSRVLDVGCAGGRDSEKFFKAGFEVVGIDAVDVFVEEAAKRIPQAKFIKMNLLDLNFPKDYFDAIWAQAVLLHLERKDITQVLKNFRNILKNGGKIHIAVKEGKGTGWEADKLSADKKRFFTYFSKEEMETYIRDAGFRIISSEIISDDAKRKNVKWIIIWAEK